MAARFDARKKAAHSYIIYAAFGGPVSQLIRLPRPGSGEGVAFVSIEQLDDDIAAARNGYDTIQTIAQTLYGDNIGPLSSSAT